jgi:serine acetyltransferase
MSIRNHISNRLSKFEKIGIWGAGNLGKNALRYWLPKEKVSLIIDKNPKQNPYREKIKFASPEQVNFSEIDAVVICTSARNSVIKYLKKLTVTIPIFYIYELFLPEKEAPIGELQALSVDIAAIKNSAWPIFLIKRPQILVNITFRIGNCMINGGEISPLYWLAMIIHSIVCILFSIQLPLGTKIGPGLIFAHYGTIVFNRNAKIGSFFTIYQGCTVGMSDSGESPVIGNYVFQYSGSHILGNSNIGNHTRVGANAVVIDLDCGANSVIVGVPGIVIQ